jgi:hypothetical protein
MSTPRAKKRFAPNPLLGDRKIEQIPIDSLRCHVDRNVMPRPRPNAESRTRAEAEVKPRANRHGHRDAACGRYPPSDPRQPYLAIED